MNNIKNLYSKIPFNNKTFKISLIVITIITISICIIFIVKHRRHSLENPTFFLKPKLTQKKITINKSLLFEPKNGYEFTWTFWIYITDWKYRLNKDKHIFTKGRLEENPIHCCPAIFLDKSINDMIFYIQTTKNTIKYRIKDIPINKWNHIGISVSNKIVDLYIDGKLYKSFVLTHLPKLNHADLYVNYFGGFNGKLSKLSYFPVALQATDLLKQFKSNPINSGILNSLYNKMSNKHIDIEKHSPEPDPKEEVSCSSSSNQVTPSYQHHNQYYNIIGNQFISLKKNRLVKKFKINRNYSLMFTILPKGKVSGWSNIIHSTISNKNCCGPKDRLPGIWFRSNTTKLYIVNSTLGGNFSFTCPIELPLHKETHIKISVIESHFTINLSGAANYNKIMTINNKRLEGSSYFYISDPWHSKSNGLIKNVIWLNH